MINIELTTMKVNGNRFTAHQLDQLPWVDWKYDEDYEIIPDSFPIANVIGRVYRNLSSKNQKSGHWIIGIHDDGDLVKMRANGRDGVNSKYLNSLTQIFTSA